MRDAESAVLACVFIKPELFCQIGDLPERAFDKPLHRRVYRAMLAAIKQDYEPDLVLTCSFLDTNDDKAGAAALLDELPLTRKFPLYVRRLREEAYFRALMTIETKLAEMAAARQWTADQMEAKRAKAVREARDTFWPADGGSNGRQAWDSLKTFMARGGSQNLRLGFPSLDAIVGGLYPGAVVTVLARPAIGKSLLGLNICANILRRSGPDSVMFCSLEMTAAQATDRMIRIIEGWTPDELKHAGNNGHEPTRFLELTEGGRFHLWAGSGKGIRDIGAEMDAWDAKNLGRLAFVVIDHLQYVAGLPNEKAYERVSRICREVKELAKDRGCVVLLLCQVSRGDEGGKGKHCPTLEAGRDSGGIEENADVVLGMWKPDDKSQDVYLQARKVRDGGRPGVAVLRVSRANARMCEIVTEDSAYDPAGPEEPVAEPAPPEPVASLFPPDVH